MAEHICQWGNCYETETPILLTINNTDPKQRVRFCSLVHLALWAKKEAQKRGTVGLHAITVQDACNLSDVVKSFALAMDVLWAEARERGEGTAWINRHPIVTLFIDKLASLNG